VQEESVPTGTACAQSEVSDENLALRCATKGVEYGPVRFQPYHFRVQVVRLRCDEVESVATQLLRDEQTAVVMSSFRWWATLK